MAIASPGERPEGAKEAGCPRSASDAHDACRSEPPGRRLDPRDQVRRLSSRREHRARQGRLYSRNEKEWTASFPRVAEELARCPSKRVDRRRSGRARRRRADELPGTAERVDASCGASFFAFDVMYLDGHDLRGVELTERKRRCAESSATATAPFASGPEIQGRGGVFRAGLPLGLEGTVGKRADPLP